MSLLLRKLRGASTSAAIALALCASPALAQRTNLNVSGGTVTFPSPTAADYVAGYVTAVAGVTFTINSQNGLTRTTTISIRSTSGSMGGGKVIGDLEWRRSDLATWNTMTLSDAQVEQRLVVNKGLNDPWSNTIFFRLKLNWTTDAPGTYTANYEITLAQTVP
ncbi:MAG TPA: hypothetical protein VHL32_06995 [Gemmatimonadaceae bacterium]|jgi:hypothetical protein|nr:hypothetical protein [Gemmatimonadaceae bacterium]